MSLTVPPLLGTVFVPFFILGCSGLVSSGALRRGFGINRGRHYEAPFLMNQTLFYYTERSPLKPARSRSDAPTRLEDIYFLWMNAWLSIMLIIHFYYLYYQIIGQNWNSFLGTNHVSQWTIFVVEKQQRKSEKFSQFTVKVPTRYSCWNWLVLTMTIYKICFNSALLFIYIFCIFFKFFESFKTIDVNNLFPQRSFQ